MNKSVPQHAYGLVDQGILRGSTTDTKEFERCVIFGVTSIPSRALHFSILCESGAQNSLVNQTVGVLGNGFIHG